MARPLRIEFEGGFYHVTARGNEKRAIFEDEKDFVKLRDILKEYSGRFGVNLYCYVLMNNHYHLLIETPGANLTAFMHNVQSHYTNYFNRRHNRVGHLFQGRYKALIVDRDSYLLELSRYIHLNPVRAGLAAGPEEWRWSSYGACVTTGHPDAEWLACGGILKYFGRSKKTAANKYRDFVREKIGEEETADPFDGVTAQLILGPEKFVKKIRKLLEAGRGGIDANIVAGRELTMWTEQEAQKAVARVAEMFSVEEKDILKKGGHGNRARDTAIVVFHRHSRWRVSEIGALFGISGSTVSKTVERHEKISKKDGALARTTERIFQYSRPDPSSFSGSNSDETAIT